MIELFNEDCMYVMKRYDDKHFDLAIVDPPYGLGATEFISSKLRKRENKKWNNEIPSPEYFNELFRVSKNTIIWGCNYYAKYIPHVGRIVHDKKMTHTGSIGLSDCDLASQSFDKRIMLFTYEWRGNVQGGTINWKNDGLNGRIHPTQKPVQLYEWCLNKYASPTDKILDTHLGSGGSAIASHFFGCDFVGCEIDKEYFDKSKKRIKEITSQIKMF